MLEFWHIERGLLDHMYTKIVKENLSCSTIIDFAWAIANFVGSRKAFFPFVIRPCRLTIMDYTGRLLPGLLSGLSRGRAGGGRPPPYLYRKLRPEGPKKNFGDRPTSSLFKALDDRVPPLSQIHWSQMYNTQYNGHNGIRTCNLICNFHFVHPECAWYKSVASGS